MKRLLPVLAAAALVSGCASVNPRPAFTGVEKTVSDPRGRHPAWARTSAEAEQVEPSVRGRLKDDLTAEAETESERTIKAWLVSYDAAFNSKDLGRLAAFYHPDVTIFEGGGTNNGWQDYRDNHIGPELKEFENLEFSHANVVPHVLGEGRSAYVTAEYRLKARVGGKDVDASGLETLILVKSGDGAWKIRHSHTSSRRKAPQPRPSGTGKP